MSWRDTLAKVLQAAPPQRVCALDTGAADIARDLLPESTIASFTDHPPAPPAQLALVKTALNPLDIVQARVLLTRVRDYVSPRIIVIADGHCPLGRMDFLAMGYETLGKDDTEPTTLYQYDLATYKQVPDWLNARFWAHPERWER